MSEALTAYITQFATQYAQVAFGLGQALANNNGPGFQAQAKQLLETAYNLDPGEKETFLQLIANVRQDPYQNVKNILEGFRSQGLLPPLPADTPNIQEIGRTLSQDQKALTTSGHISLYLGCWRYLQAMVKVVRGDEFTSSQHTEVKKALNIFLGVMPVLGLQDHSAQPAVASVVAGMLESLTAEATSFNAEIYPSDLGKFLEAFRQARLIPAREEEVTDVVEFLWEKNKVERVRGGFSGKRHSEASRTRSPSINDPIIPDVPEAHYPFVDPANNVVMIQTKQGSIVPSDFVLKRHLADGGMSRALVVGWTHDGRKEDVVLKYCMSNDPRHQEVFGNDCEKQRGFAGKVDGYVPIFERGKLSDGKPFAIYPFMEQGDGASWINRMQSSGERYHLKDARELILRILQILAASHAQNIAHRDMKPENILFAENRVAFVNDCGLARTVTPGERMYNDIDGGTLRYLPPEFTPEDFVPKDPHLLPDWWASKVPDYRQWDVFAAALTFFEFLTRGLHPYIPHIESIEEAFAILLQWRKVAVNRATPTPLSDHCPELCEVDHSDDDILARLKITRPPHYLESTLAKGMALNPAERYKDAGEFLYAVLTGEAQDKIDLGRMILEQVSAAYQPNADPDLLQKRTRAQELEDIEHGETLYTTGMQALEALHQDHPRMTYFHEDILGKWSWLYAWSDPLGRVDLMKKAQEGVEKTDPQRKSPVFQQVHEQFPYVLVPEGGDTSHVRIRSICVKRYERRAGRWVVDPLFKRFLKQVPSPEKPFFLPRPLIDYYEIVVETDRTESYSGPLPVRRETLERLSDGGMRWVSGDYVPVKIPFIETIYFPSNDLVPGGMGFEWTLTSSGDVPAQQVYGSYAERPPVWLNEDAPEWLKGKQVMKNIPNPIAFRVDVTLQEYCVYVTTLPGFNPQHSAWPHNWRLINPSGPIRADNIRLSGMNQGSLKDVLDRPVTMLSSKGLEGYLAFLNHIAQSRNFRGEIRLMTLDEQKWISKVGSSLFPWGDNVAQEGDADFHFMPEGVSYHRGAARRSLIPRSLRDTEGLLDTSVYGRGVDRVVPRVMGITRFDTTSDLKARLGSLFGLSPDEVEKRAFTRGGSHDQAPANNYDAIQASRVDDDAADYAIKLVYVFPPEALGQQ